MPWFRKLRTTIWHKIGIGALLCSGVFLIIIAILRNVLSLQNIEVDSARCIWATRETVSEYESPSSWLVTDL